MPEPDTGSNVSDVELAKEDMTLLSDPAGHNYQDRPALRQVTESDLADAEADAPVGTTYNLWFGRWSGGDKDPSLVRRASPFRCIAKRDAGSTKGDQRENAPLCLYFAKGMCAKGSSCKFLHRLPEQIDLTKIPGAPATDCFGRERFAEYRDDMAGVGSFLHKNCSLFVTGLKPRKNLQHQLYQQFGEWGRVDSVRLLNDKHSAIVRYVNEAAAQFAKEAMANQSLGPKNELLTVKWAKQPVLLDMQTHLENDPSLQKNSHNAQDSSLVEDEDSNQLISHSLRERLKQKHETLKRKREASQDTGPELQSGLVNYPDSD